MSESNDAATPAAEPAAAAAPAAKGGKLMTILALVNFIALLGLGGYFFYTQQHAAAQPKKADDAHGEKKEDGHGEQAKAGEGHGGAAEEEEKEEEEAEEGEHGGAKAEGHGKPAEGHGKPAGGHGKAEEHGDDSAEEHSASGPLLVLDSMVTNMADPDSDRYLKVGLQLRITSEAAKAEVETHLVPVRNQILLYLSSLTIAETSGAENKRAIQKRIKRLANEAMPSSRITEVYFTEFVIQ